MFWLDERRTYFLNIQPLLVRTRVQDISFHSQLHDR